MESLRGGVVMSVTSGGGNDLNLQSQDDLLGYPEQSKYYKPGEAFDSPLRISQPRVEFHHGKQKPFLDLQSQHSIYSKNWATGILRLEEDFAKFQ